MPVLGCCWPLWGNKGRPTHQYCAAERAPGTVYCSAHYRKAYVGRVADRKAGDPPPDYSPYRHHHRAQ